MKVREIIRFPEKDGWYLCRTKGSHRQFRHPDKKGLVTVSGRLGGDVAPSVLNGIFKQARPGA